MVASNSPRVNVPPPEVVRMGFGRYRDRPVSQVPLGYLYWAFFTVENMRPRLREVIRRHIDASGLARLYWDAYRNPHDRDCRARLADQFLTLKCPHCATRAFMIRLPLDHPDYSLVCHQTAKALEDSSPRFKGLFAYAQLQNRIRDYRGPNPTDKESRLAMVRREYATLLANWRGWLPDSITTLGKRADREAYNRDYYEPQVAIPSRRKEGGLSPRVAVLFVRGLPREIDCDGRDWQRCGIDMLTLFPWVIARVDGRYSTDAEPDA